MIEEDIYSIVPDDAFDESVSFDKRQEILTLLKGHKGEVLTARFIANIVQLPTRGTQVEVRKAITQLIELDKEPIISTAKGFMYALQPNQLHFYADRLEERVRGIQRRINSIRNIADTHNFNEEQMTLQKKQNGE